MAENESNVDEGFKPIRPKFHFGAWLRLHGVDLITMVFMGALALGIFQACEQTVTTIMKLLY